MKHSSWALNPDDAAAMPTLLATELSNLQIRVKMAFYIPGTVGSALHIKKWDVLAIVTREIFSADPLCWWIKHLWFGLFSMTECVRESMCLTRRSGKGEARDCCSSHGVMF